MTTRRLPWAWTTRRAFQGLVSRWTRRVAFAKASLSSFTSSKEGMVIVRPSPRYSSKRWSGSSSFAPRR